MLTKRRLVSFIALLFLVFVVFGLQRLVIIHEVACKSQFGPCGQDLERVILPVKEKSLFEAKQELKASLNDNNLIDRYLLQYKLWDKLSVQVVIRKASYAVGDEKAGVFYLIDSNGNIFLTLPSTNLPTLYVDDFRYERGQTLPNSVLTLLEIYSDMNSLYKVKKGILYHDRMEIALENNPLVIFPYDQEREILVGSARLIIEQLNSAQQKFKIEKGVGDLVVDLRYKNPVIR